MTKNKEKKIFFGKFSKTEKNFLHVCRDDFKGPHLDYQDLSIPLNLKKKIEHTKIHNKNFLELFEYHGVSLWWFFHHYPFFGDYFLISFNFIMNFNEFLQKSNPTIVKIVDDFEMFDLIKQICMKNSIPLEYSKTSYFKSRIIKKLKNFIRKNVRHYRLKKYVKLRIKNHKILYNHKIPSIDNKIIFASPTAFRRPYFNHDTDKYENGEHILQGLIDILKTKFETAGISIAHGTSKTKDDMLIDRLNSNFLWIPEEVIFQNFDKSKDHKNFIHSYKKLIESKQFQTIFEIEGINIWEQIKPGFYQMLHEPYLPYWLSLLDSYALFFSSNKPKAIFIVCETDAPSLALIYNARKNNIKTIAIQHGEGIEDCEHSVSVLSSSKNPLGYPFANKMLVFGEFWKRAFVNHDYPSEKFEVFGNPNFFDLKNFSNISNFDNLYKKYNLDKNKKIILFTTSRFQGFPDRFNFDVKAWKHLLENFAYNKNFSLILKIHPHEDPTIFQNILNNFQNSHAKIVDGNIVELLSICSVLVSNKSTTLVDSICLKKPTIEIEWDNVVQKQIPLKASNVVLSSKLNDVTKNIHEILNNKKLQNDLLLNRDKFLKDHYNIPITKTELEQTLQKIIFDN